MTEVIKERRSYKGSDNPAWNGGKVLIDDYWYIWCPDHPNATKIGYVVEHRLIMEEYLSRYLTREESVHHLDMNKENNRIGNLMLFTNLSEHRRYEGADWNKKDMSNRICLLCDSNKTHTRHWFKYKNGFVCFKCYNRLRYHKK